LAALHTGSQTLVVPPRVHGLVTGGGLPPAEQEGAGRHGLLLPARVVMAVFRGKMVDASRRTLAHGAFGLPDPMGPQQGRTLLNRMGHPTQPKGNVRIMERDAHGAGASRIAPALCAAAPSSMLGLERGTGTTSPSPLAPGRRRRPARVLGFS